MIEVHCRTALDLRGEVWPTMLPEVPRVGDHIQSATKRGEFKLELEVVRVTWRHRKDDTDFGHDRWYAHVELHMTSFHKGLPCSKGAGSVGSIRAFYEWYAPIVGTTASAFI